MTVAATQINLRDALAVWRRNVVVHLRLWKLNLVAPIIEPVISVLGFGWGIGALVAGKVTGIPYLTFVGAGLLGVTVLMRAMFETTYAAYFRMVYQSTYDAILAPLPLLTGATFMAGLSLGITAHVHDIDAFNVYMAVFFSTMYVSGAFFPLDVLPMWLQIPARVLPMTESIDLTRAFLTGRFLVRHAYEAAYLLISALVACEWAMRSLRRRMVA